VRYVLPILFVVGVYLAQPGRPRRGLGTLGTPTTDRERLAVPGGLLAGTASALLAVGAMVYARAAVGVSPLP